MVQKNNLVEGMAEASQKWNKRWPDIEQPQPVEGTLNSEVIRTIRTLVTRYKASEKKRKKGEKRAEKRQTEFAMLHFFDQEGQKLRAATKEKNRAAKKDIE